LISFRYHIVSLVAVFLALAIGIAAGSTVIKESVVNNLQANVDSVNKRLNDVEKHDRDLTAELAALHQLDKGLSDEGARQFLVNRLFDRPVLVVSVDGVDGDALGAMRTDLKVAGARVAAVLRLNSKLALDNPDDQKSLAAIIGSGTDADSTRGALVDRLAALVLRASATTTTGSTTTTGEVAAPPVSPLLSLLVDLDKHGFVSLSALVDDPTTLRGPLTTIVLSGAGAKLDDAQVVVPFLRKVATGPHPLVLAAEANPAGGAVTRGSFVGPIRADIGLRGRVATVDDMESFAGRAAAVLSLVDLEQGHVGHYGIATDADRLLPSPTTP
jgi:hypothetical protein